MNTAMQCCRARMGRVVDPTIQEYLSLQLYMRIVTSGARGCAWCGLDVLEIGSGRGGGAAYLAGGLAPRRLVRLDISGAATALARRRYGSAAPLEYRQGDAEGLPFDAQTFDLVLNVESAHCYASIPLFLAEVHRVLRPGGELLLADFVSRRGGAFRGLQEMLAASPLALFSLDEITDNVLVSLPPMKCASGLCSTAGSRGRSRASPRALTRWTAPPCATLCNRGRRSISWRCCAKLARADGRGDRLPAGSSQPLVLRCRVSQTT